MTVDDDEEDMDTDDAEQAKAHKRHRNGFSIPSRRASSAGAQSSASNGGSRAQGSSARRTSSVPRAAPDSSSDALQRTMLVTGFPRVLEKPDRLAWYNAHILPRFSVSVQAGMCFKPLGFVSSAFQVEFATAAQLHVALDTLKAAEIHFVDVEEDNSKHPLLFRRAKTLTQKKQGRFNSFFYKALDKYISDHPHLAGFVPKPMGGVMYIVKGKTYHNLIKFKKVGEFGWSPELQEATVTKLGINSESIKAMVQTATVQATEAMEE